MKQTLHIDGTPCHIYDLPRAARARGAGEALLRLPYSLRILLENALRHAAQDEQAAAAVTALLDWQPNAATPRPAVPFYPARVLLQDLTGVPLVVDLAAMRAALARMGGDPARISPVIPADLVIDHSVHVDVTGTPDAMARNIALEYERNHERYALLRWAQEAFDTLRVVPPGKGICHQVNLEALATVVAARESDGETTLFPDSVFGTDSHTPMINGLGVLGWGVGGIEAISAMLGKSVEIVLPDVIGLELTGSLREGVMPTGLTLAIVERLRQEGVVGKFIEAFGDGLDNISLPDRAMIANMTPESGATVTYFPVDAITLDYLRLSGRDENLVRRVKAYCKAQALFRDTDAPLPHFSRVITIDLRAIEPSLAGPTRPQDRMPMRRMAAAFGESLAKPRAERGFEIPAEARSASAVVTLEGSDYTLRHGSLLIAAITSCTNTSNPAVMLAAGLLAKHAVERGLAVSPTVKCSLMPGSRVVTEYLQQAGLLEPLAALGFGLAGYGCGSCIGNSGPLAPGIAEAVQAHHLVAASISSANRNFEGRIHPATRANYLAAPPLVVAYALAGRVDIDLASEPLGTGRDGKAVYLSDIYPARAEVEEWFSIISPELFRASYRDLFSGDERWQAIPTSHTALYAWDPASTYIQQPPYFAALEHGAAAQPAEIRDARVLAWFGDSITTDHISPAGSIAPRSAAAEYLQAQGVAPAAFNSYGARRGNDRVLARGTFANIRLKNRLVPGVEGGVTRLLPQGDVLRIYDAAQRYQQTDTPLIILAGKEYGTGSSRDWAAKGPLLLGVRAVIAQSFERIHRANLVGMGVLPLEFLPGENADTLGLNGEECYTLRGLDALTPRQTLTVEAVRPDGNVLRFTVTARIDTPGEVRMFQCGGILHEALLQMRA
ncbi:MAG: aconitate hydratase AcnA [Anaerolineae bacterium]|nr:aconitate hydratase AcnA [Anaerolineae bacterium]